MVQNDDQGRSRSRNALANDPEQLQPSSTCTRDSRHRTSLTPGRPDTTAVMWRGRDTDAHTPPGVEPWSRQRSASCSLPRSTQHLPSRYLAAGVGESQVEAAATCAAQHRVHGAHRLSSALHGRPFRVLYARLTCPLHRERICHHKSPPTHTRPTAPRCNMPARPPARPRTLSPHPAPAAPTKRRVHLAGAVVAVCQAAGVFVGAL